MDAKSNAQTPPNEDSSSTHNLNPKPDSHVSGGLRWLALGIALMGMSFGVNFIFDDAGTSFVVVMYTLTTLGAACVLKCMVDIFG
jgi:hypothetical protein